MTGSFTLSSLEYTVAKISSTNNEIIQITTNFEWPGKTAIYVQIDGLTNPLINETGIFSAVTSYDSVSIDQTDPVDMTNKLQFQ